MREGEGDGAEARKRASTVVLGYAWDLVEKASSSIR